jgi:stage V sporulation protein R
MTGSLLRDAEVVDYACQHAGAMGGDDGPMNPYKLGLELYRHLLAAGPAAGRRGLDRLFEARAGAQRPTFVDSVLDEDFCRSHGLAQDAPSAPRSARACSPR